MADGTTKPIDKIQLGELVLATDPKTGETAAQEVTDLILGSGLKDLIRVGTDPDGDGITDWITATDGHPFFVPARGWIEADDLTVGDLLVANDGSMIKVTRLSEAARIAVVHNLTVDRIHTYYVMAGAKPILVHNAGCSKGKFFSKTAKTQRAAKARAKQDAKRHGGCYRGLCSRRDHYHVDYRDGRTVHYRWRNR